MLDSISAWITENFGSLVGFFIALLLFVVPLVLYFSARIAYIFNIGNMRDRKIGGALDSSGDGGGFFSALGSGDFGGGDGGDGGDGGGE